MCGQPKQKTNQTSTYKPTDQAGGLYSNIIGQATNAATTPYNPATGKTIADFNPMQTAGFAGVQNAQGTGQGALDAAGNLITSGAAPISADQIQHYADPHQQAVIDAAIAQMNQQNGVAQSNLAGNAAAQGALGGNRVGVAQANLAGEQGRNANSMVAGLLSQGYGQALSAAQQDAQRQQVAAGQQMNLGQLQQSMTYADLQAMLAAGGQQQQQQQSVNDANSANATSQTMWPYQNAQWLAGIGSAIGPLTGGTTTGNATTSQGKGAGQIVGAGLTAASLLSDRRAKEDVKPVGKTFDGQTVYSFRYKGSPQTQMGLIADEVHDSHPDAVGQHPSGFEMVDYGKATEDAADRGRFAAGGGVGFDAMWNQLKPSAPIMPQLAAAPAAAPGGGQQSPQAAVQLGKSARSGIDNILRKLSPTQGWADGTSIEPTAGAGAGKGILGFAGGGEVQLAGLSPRDFARTDLEYLRRPKGFKGPNDRPPLKDEFIGEIGPMGGGNTLGDMPMAMGDPNFMGSTDGGYFPEMGSPPVRDMGTESYADGGATGWGFRGISPTYGGKTLADFLGGKAPIDIGSEAMPTVGADPLDMGAEAMPTTGPDTGAQLPPMPERGRASIGDISGVSMMRPGELIEDTPWQDEGALPPDMMQTDVETNRAAPGNSTIDFIKQEEGKKLRAYADGTQHSIGWGTRASHPGEQITDEEAERRLHHEVGNVETWLDSNVKVPMSEGRRTALTSLGFNSGTGALQKLLPDINAGDWGTVADRMLTFNKARNKKTGLLEPVLTPRREREVALVRDENSPVSAPESATAEVRDAAPSLVAKAKSPDVVAQDAYSGPKDKAAGGILKNLFGVDFNPLKLDENERMSLLAAGLSMMSSGDIGGGGLAGLNYLTKARASDRDAASDAQKLKLQMAQTEALGRGKWHSAGNGMILNDATGETRSAANNSAAPTSIEQFEPAIQERARNIAAGREAMPNITRGDLTAQQTQQAVRMLDPNFSGNRFKYRQEWENPNKITGRTRVANNTAIAHAGELSELVDQLPDTGVRTLNAAKNWWKGETTDPALMQWKATASLLADEITKVMVPTGGTQQDRMEQLEKLNPQNGRAAINGVLKQYTKLLKGKTDALTADWQKNMGPTAEQPEILDLKAQEGVAKLEAKYPDAVKANDGKPKVGTVEDGYRFKGGNPSAPSSWEAVQ